LLKFSRQGEVRFLRVSTHVKDTKFGEQLARIPRQIEKTRGSERMILRFIPSAWRVTLLTMAIFALPSFAQEKPDSPRPKVQPDVAEKPAVDPQDKEANDEVPKRIFWIIPNFMTANDQPENQGPLTVEQKYNIAWHQFWDLSAHFGNVVQASISQAANGLPHYGQGWGAFGERYLAQEGDQFTGSMLIYGLLPSVLHQDPRYFRRGRGSAWARVAHAASRVVIARTNSGTPTFNASQVFGQLGQASISMLYYPKEDRELEGVLTGWAINQAYNIAWNQLKEFTPDLGAYIKRHSKKKNKAPQVQDSRSPLSESRQK
jgi:hypothetical protein